MITHLGQTKFVLFVAINMLKSVKN